ncbi:MAG: outer membrane lipoprotein carrier protein LolA [Sinobacteraceae bacterium]|nr:outer membrane lipoprotein carrier protein LolA [Nevskiaceae bacterium]
MHGRACLRPGRTVCLAAGAMLALLACSAVQAKPVDQVAAVFNHPAEKARLATMLEPVTHALHGAAAVQGHFRQRNFLHGLPQPLESSGTFMVARGLGVDWHVLKPFNAETILTATRLVQKNADGSEQILGADHQPGLAAVERTFDAMFTLDLDQLEQRFKLYGQEKDGTWTLGLKPRDAALAAHLRAVVIVGDEHPQQVTLYQAGGDRTEIRFADVSVDAKLNAAQRRLFQP